MRRPLVLSVILAMLSLACALGGWIGRSSTPMPTIPVMTVTVPPPSVSTSTPVSANLEDLDGPDISYHGIHLSLDPALGSHLYAFDEELMDDDGHAARYTRLSLTPEEYCQTWCIEVYPVREFEQAFGRFVFPPLGYYGGAAVIFDAQEAKLSFQNGSGSRSLQTFGQMVYFVSNDALKYAFRGFSEDGQLAVYVQIPVRTDSLPNIAPTWSADGETLESIQAYNQHAADTLNTKPPADFTPNLNLLDALVVSIRVEIP